MAESKTFKFLDFEVRVVDGMIHMYNSNERFEKEPEKVINLATWVTYMEHLIKLCMDLDSEPFPNAAQRDAIRELHIIKDNGMAIGREAYRQGGAHLLQTASEEAKAEISRMKCDNAHHAAMQEKENKIILPGDTETTAEPKKLIIPEE